MLKSIIARARQTPVLATRVVAPRSHVAPFDRALLPFPRFVNSLLDADSIRAVTGDQREEQTEHDADNGAEIKAREEMPVKYHGRSPFFRSATRSPPGVNSTPSSN